jgi:hypothetical protein
MRRIALAVALSFAARAGGADVPVPVLVELFTSEGCSSCPPADALLARYLRDQPVPGVRIIGLSEHVDYWNDLGWRDPFSSPTFTRRQGAYARRLGSGIYTPQLVVSGAGQLVGSRDGDARRAIAAAAARARGDVQASKVPGSTGVLEVKARWPDAIDAEVLVAVVQDHATTEVARGENAGRTLEHAAVARDVIAVGSGRGAFSGRVAVSGAPRGDRAVVFVQQHDGGPVLAATVVDLRGG